MPMSKVKKLLAVGCGTSLAILVGLGGVLWVRGNAAPEYKIPEWKLPTPNAYDTLMTARKLEDSKLGRVAVSPMGKYDEKQDKFVYPPQPLEDRKTLLAKNQATINKLREAMTQEFATPQAPGDLSALADNFPRFADYRELARMLFFASRTYADLGQNDKAAECSVDAMALGMLVSHRSQLIGNLTGIACEEIGRKSLWELVDRVDAKTARTAAARLEILEGRRYPFSKVLLDERDSIQSNAFTLFQFNVWQLADGYSEPDDEHTIVDEEQQKSTLSKSKQLLKRTATTAELLWYTKKQIFAASGRYMTELAQYSERPYDPKSTGPKLPTDPVNATMLPTFNLARDKDIATRAETRLALLCLALRAYKLEKGSYPATLVELVSTGYLKALPDDPFAPRFGQPFGYRRESGDKFTLWSCGPDGDDDNGRAIVAKDSQGRQRRYAQTGDEGDLVARVNTY